MMVVATEIFQCQVGSLIVVVVAILDHGSRCQVTLVGHDVGHRQERVSVQSAARRCPNLRRLVLSFKHHRA